MKLGSIFAVVGESLNIGDTTLGLIDVKHLFMPELAREADMKSGMTKAKSLMSTIWNLVAKWST